MLAFSTEKMFFNTKFLSSILNFTTLIVLAISNVYALPPNARSIPGETGWRCIKNYTRSNDSCVKIQMRQCFRH